MAVSMVSGRESEQELEESHLMLKNAWPCFSISSSFVTVGNNPSLQIHSFSEDRGKGNKTVTVTVTVVTVTVISHGDRNSGPKSTYFNFKLVNFDLES